MKFFSLIEGENIHLAPDKKVIPAEQFSKLVDAHFILEQAKKEEKTYRNQVSKECEGLKEQAELVGFEEGLQQWNDQIRFLEKEIQCVRQEMENFMVPLALTAVKKILGRELKTEPETVVDIIATSLKAVLQHRKIKIYVNPIDHVTVETARPRLKGLFEHLDSLVIASRKDITEGGCIIETEAGIINAQLESLLKTLEKTFHTFFQNNKGD